jgi:hypothetical protein
LQTQKRKNRPVDDYLDAEANEVNLEDLHRDDYDNEDFDYEGYEEDYPLPEKRKNQAPVYFRDRRFRRRRKLLFVTMGLAFFLSLSISFAVRTTISSSTVSQNVKDVAGGLAKTLAHDLGGSLAPGIASIAPLLLVVFGLFFVMRVMRRRYRD